MNVMRHTIGRGLHWLAWWLSRFAFWVEVWRCEECGQYSRDPIPYDSFEHTCPNCGKEASV